MRTRLFKERRKVLRVQQRSRATFRNGVLMTFSITFEKSGNIAGRTNKRK
jgi:hypothetical protein